MTFFREVTRNAISTCPRGYDALRIVLALPLLAAAALKSQQLMTEGVLGSGLLGSRWFLIAVVEFELFFGLWLLSGLLPRLTWLAALGCFSAFASVALFKAISGAASCGCFGRVAVSPWYTVSFDGIAIVSLLFWRPRRLAPPFERRAGGEGESAPLRAFAPSLVRLAVVFGAWLLLGVSAGIAMGTNRDTTMSDAGQVLAGGKIILLQPEMWIGKRLPLLPYIDNGAILSRGDWLVVFHRQGCQKCQERLPSFARLAADWAGHPGKPRVVFVEMPPFTGRDVGPANMRFVTAARLSDAKEWFVETPVAVMVKSGEVGELL
jgi:hypothetical protein